MENGSCMFCGYPKGMNSSTSKKEEPKNTATAPAHTEEEIQEMKSSEFAGRQKKVVTLSNGTQAKTEIPGVYEVASLSGTAVTSPQLEVQKAVGLSEEQIAAGTNASIYMGNLCDFHEKETAKDIMGTLGKNIVTMFVSDMYTIAKNGQMGKIHETRTPISMVIGLPGYAVDANKAYSIMCLIDNGNIVEMKDMDNDPSTITINATAFGNYVIVY